MADDGNVLELEGVNTFYGQSHVLYDVSLNVAPGEVVALVGRNGAGKTTTLRSVMGLTSPRSGEVRLKGEEIQTLATHEIRQRGVSWVPEDRRVFPDLSVYQNLRIAAGDDDFGDIYERFPRLEERRDQRAGTLSGGEQQMLSIARALLGYDLEILLLDEPSEGLAPSIVDDVFEIVRRLNDAGTTILLVEQNAERALDLADRAYVIEKGTMTYEGDASELLADREAMERHLGVS